MFVCVYISIYKIIDAHYLIIQYSYEVTNGCRLLALRRYFALYLFNDSKLDMCTRYLCIYTYLYIFIIPANFCFLNATRVENTSSEGVVANRKLSLQNSSITRLVSSNDKASKTMVLFQHVIYSIF